MYWGCFDPSDKEEGSRDFAIDGFFLIIVTHIIQYCQHRIGCLNTKSIFCNEICYVICYLRPTGKPQGEFEGSGHIQKHNNTHHPITIFCMKE